MSKTKAIMSVLLLAAGCKTDSSSNKAADRKPPEAAQAAGRSGTIDVRTPALPSPSATAPQGRGGETAGAPSEQIKRNIATYDADHDGELSAEELAVAHAARASTLKSRFDKDGDGILSISELGATHMFRRGGSPATFDTNRDGEISEDELAAGIAKFRDREPR